MIPYPNISPEIFRIGPFAVRWYGLMYAVGFASSFILVRHQLRKKSPLPKGKGPAKEERAPIPEAFLESLYTYLVLGLILGARLGYNETGAGHPIGTTNTRYTVGGSLAATGFQTGQTTTQPEFLSNATFANLPAAGLNSFNAGQFSFVLFNSAMS